MKTVTEFDGFSLKNALSKKTELLAGGKSAEELPAALGEALKVEGDKLTNLLSALEVAEAKSDNLKRVVVLALNEGEKAPHGAVQKGERYFLAEFFYTPQPKRQQRGHDERPGKGGKGKRGKGKGRRGRGGKPGDRAPQHAASAGGEGQSTESGDQPRKRFNRRPPRRDGASRNAGSGAPNVKPNVKPNETAASAEASATAPEAANKQ